MRPTFSTLERAVRCPGHLALPRVITTSPAAERGSAIHQYLEAVGNGVDAEEALALVPADWRPLCAAIDLDRLPKGLAAEVAFAYDVVTGKARELGRGIGRKYDGLTPYEIAGTADIVGVSEDAIYCGDYKSGWSELPPAGEAFQLKIGALAAARTYQKDRAVVEFVRIKENGSSWRDRAELDDFDLDAFAAEVRPIRVAIERAQKEAGERGAPDVSVGPWCRHCPSWSACPANKALIQRIAAGVEFDEFHALQPLTPEAAGAAYERLKVIKAAVRRVDDAVLAAREQFGELPLPSGKVLREVIEPGNEQLDGRVVFAVVRDRLGPTVAEAAVDIEATKTSLGRAIKQAAQDGTIKPRTGAKWERDLLDDVRKKGGAERPMRKKLVEFDPAQAPAVEGAALPPASLPAPAPVASAPPGPDEAERIAIEERLGAVFDAKDPAAEMQLIHYCIRMGMEGNVEAWSPLLRLWGRANEELKARAQGAA